MRGDDQQNGHLFSYLSPEQRVPADHPWRAIRQMTDEALRQLSPQFEAIYATTGRPSVPPEQFTLLEAWAGQKSFTRKDGTRAGPSDDDPGNPTVNFHGERRSNTTHASTTDPDSRLAKKGPGREAKLAYVGEVLMENGAGLVVDACVVQATGTAERDAATALLQALAGRPATVGGDKAYDTRAWVESARAIGVTPHVAQAPHSAIDGRTTRHPGYTVSQRHRKRVEEIFGGMKTVGGLRKLRHRGTATVEWQFLFVAAVYNLVRLRNLPVAPA